MQDFDFYDNDNITERLEYMNNMKFEDFSKCTELEYWCLFSYKKAQGNKEWLVEFD